MKWIQLITKFVILKSLKVLSLFMFKIIENYVDIIQSEDLDDVEESLNRINQQVIDKRSLIEVRRSIIWLQKSDKKVV